ncbi:MAG TPA: class F sortase [Chloroflexia bacterium]|nr:class F sortase [Chloroflexia bacterium]
MKLGKNPRYSKFATTTLAATLVLAAFPFSSYAAPTQAPPTASPKAQALPASLPFADSAFESVWMRNDQLVAAKSVARSWTWGPAPMSAGLEAYEEAPDGSKMRLVQYFDKARMEINNPRSNPTANGFVTNGLLTVELISGQMQVGNSKFVTGKPAGINLASDPDDGNAPMYASFGSVANTSAGEKRQPDKSKGGYASQRISRTGDVTEDASKTKLAEAKIVYFEKLTGHNIPSVFWDFLNSKAQVRQGIGTASKPFLDPWVFAMGLPISDAYWANVKIGGKQQEVLIQAFERRVLTYAPDQPAGWKVQMGNIGQHYFEWRYGPNGKGPEKLPAAKPSLPTYLTIPTMGVVSKVEHVGVDKNNNMDIPKEAMNVGWFKPGTIPGNPGNSVIDGHLNWYGVAEAVFFHLDKLKAGDRVYVRDDKGRDRAFVVTKQVVCAWNNCPLMDVFGPTKQTRLNLITCQGTFDRATQNYEKRLVVFTEMVP